MLDEESYSIQVYGEDVQCYKFCLKLLSGWGGVKRLESCVNDCKKLTKNTKPKETKQTKNKKSKSEHGETYVPIGVEEPIEFEIIEERPPTTAKPAKRRTKPTTKAPKKEETPPSTTAKPVKRRTTPTITKPPKKKAETTKSSKGEYIEFIEHEIQEEVTTPSTTTTTTTTTKKPKTTTTKNPYETASRILKSKLNLTSSTSSRLTVPIVAKQDKTADTLPKFGKTGQPFHCGYRSLKDAKKHEDLIGTEGMGRIVGGMARFFQIAKMFTLLFQ